MSQHAGQQDPDVVPGTYPGIGFGGLKPPKQKYSPPPKHKKAH